MVRYEMKQQTRWTTKTKATKTMNDWKKAHAFYPKSKKPFFQLKQKGSQWAVFAKERSPTLRLSRRGK